MKKTNRRFALNRETLRRLEDLELPHANGGGLGGMSTCSIGGTGNRGSCSTMMDTGCNTCSCGAGPTFAPF
jgi:hypothetical protein